MIEQTTNEYTLTGADLAARFGVNERTIQRWVAKSLLPAPLRIGRRFLRWRLCDIEMFEQQKSHT